MSQRELLERAKAGDRAALSSILESIEPQIYRYGLRMCRHTQDAEDILQDTMISVAQGLGNFREDAQLSTWVYSIARSHCLKRRRRGKFEPAFHQPAEALEELSEDSGDQEKRALLKEAWLQVSDGLRKLEDDNREVLILRDVEGLSADETAKALGLSLPAMKSRLHRARKSLRALLGSVQQEGCPDIVAAFSRKLEEELTPSSCAEMEKHLENCEHCRDVCVALQHDLKACQMAPREGVPPDLAARIRQTVSQIPRYSGGL